MTCYTFDPFEISGAISGIKLKKAWDSYLTNLYKETNSSSNDLDFFWKNVPVWIDALDAGLIQTSDFKSCILNGPYYNGPDVSSVLGFLGRVCADRNIFPDYVETVFRGMINLPHISTEFDHIKAYNPADKNWTDHKIMSYATSIFNSNKPNDFYQSVMIKYASPDVKPLALFLERIEFMDTDRFCHHARTAYLAEDDVLDVLDKHRCVYEIGKLLPHHFKKLTLTDYYYAYQNTKDINGVNPEWDLAFKINMIRFYMLKLGTLEPTTDTLNLCLLDDELDHITLDSIAREYPEHVHLIELCRSLDSVEPLLSVLHTLTDRAEPLPELCP